MWSSFSSFNIHYKCKENIKCMRTCNEYISNCLEIYVLFNKEFIGEVTMTVT